MTNFFPPPAWLLMGMLALAWLVPNHYAPWTAFHSEFLSALAMVSVGGLLFLKNRLRLAWGFWQFLPLVMLIQVVLDWGFGTIASGGIAWLSGLYLTGFAVAVRLGVLWQANSDGEAADFVFGAVLSAAVVSAILQCLQLGGYQTDAFWFNPTPHSFRMDANLAQPNHLATLELLAVVGCSWLRLRGKISIALGIACAALLVVGIALTGSRAAVITGAALLAAYPFCLASHQSRPAYLLTAALLGVWYAALLAVMPLILELVNATNPTMHARSIQGDARLQIWSLAVDAIQRHPWWGYGWGQIPAAQMAVAPENKALEAFNSAHNVFLDLALWGGVPMACIVAAFACRWTWRQMQMPLSLRRWHALLFVGVLQIHAMLELPLHYAYFLLPLGLMLGTLEPTRILGSVSALRKLTALAGLALATLALWLTGVDYLKIELAEKLLRLEAVHAKYSASDDAKMPKLMVLTHFEDFFLLSRLSPTKGLSKEQLLSMQDVVRSVPSEHLMYNLAANFALNGYEGPARRWMHIACKTKGMEICRKAATNWRVEGLERVSGMPWSIP